MPRIPMASLSGPTPEKTRALQLRLYLQELERQAKIATEAFERALRTALTLDRWHDLDAIWTDLQACLFAAIIVERILKPELSSIRAKAGKSRDEARDHAEQRARDLREILEIGDDDASVFAVADVRHPLEHFDERLDEVIMRGVVGVSDWYVSHGLIAQSVGGGKHPPAAGLRVFVAPAGLLMFDDKQLDLFALDFALMELRGQIEPARARLDERAARGGRNLFGGDRLVRISSSKWQERTRAFLEQRARHGEPFDPRGLAYDGPADSEAGPQQS